MKKYETVFLLPYSVLIEELHIVLFKNGQGYEKGEDITEGIEYAKALENELQKRYKEAFERGQKYERGKQNEANNQNTSRGNV